MSSDADKKPKPITREELEGMSHKELAKVGTKKRILASLPGAEASGGSEQDDDDQAAAENLTPRQRMMRGHDKLDRARKGGDNGDRD
jgi:hypothetical protein